MLSLMALADRIRGGADSDLYRGVRDLDRRFSAAAEVSDTFMRLAEVILKLYPGRTQTLLQTSYDARIIVMDFCDHPQTSRNDVLCVLSVLIENTG